MPVVKRRVSAMGDEDPEFERDKTRIREALELYDRIQAYPAPPESVAGDSVTDLLAHGRALIAYESKRAEDIGMLFEPPCAKCGVKKECLIDISTLVGKRRTFRCKACVIGKVSCGNAGDAAEANASWRKYVAMGQGRGELGRSWRERVMAQNERDRVKKQARLDKQSATDDKRVDQVRFREAPYAVC